VSQKEVERMSYEDNPWDDPDMNDSRWSWVAVPFWWTVTAAYWVLDVVFRRKK
jgi:hypothetical protein